ncbi:MAG: hypothetical protein E6K23_16235 [Gammaproteobacteria bacterium]|nr:MAG: hypothetical protein E6K23_16235 [Gammaproteobacteria bacterium]
MASLMDAIIVYKWLLQSTSHTVRLHPLAADEAEAARAWYLARNPAVADAFLLELDAAIANIAEGPRRWPRIHGRFRRYLLH